MAGMIWRETRVGWRSLEIRLVTSGIVNVDVDVDVDINKSTCLDFGNAACRNVPLLQNAYEFFFSFDVKA